MPLVEAVIIKWSVIEIYVLRTLKKYRDFRICLNCEYSVLISTLPLIIAKFLWIKQITSPSLRRREGERGGELKSKFNFSKVSL